jgi:hypothetical protein
MGRINCIVISDYSNSKNKGKNFSIGDKVSGDLLKSTMNTQNPMFKTDDGFFIPKSCLKPTTNSYSNSNGDDGTSAEVVEEEQRLIKLPKNIKNKDFFKNKSQSAINGSIGGLILGFGFALYKGKSKMIFSVLGSIVGFGLGTVYNNYINSEEDDNKDSI